MGYVQMTLDDWMQIKDKIRRELNNQKHSFVRTGYYLRRIRDEKLYLQDGYSSLSEFAKQEFNLGASYVSRMISINEKFSIDGYSEQMDPRFEDYRQGALTEMLALPESDLQMITPATSREDIRELKRFNAQEAEPAGEQDPEAEEHRKLLAVVEDFCRQDREMVNDLYRDGIVTDEKKLMELINPSGGRTFRKSLFFISFTETDVKVKRFMKPPRDLSYREFMDLIAEVMGTEPSAAKWEECFGKEKKQEQEAPAIQQAAGGKEKHEGKGTVRGAETGSKSHLAADAENRTAGDQAGETQKRGEGTASEHRGNNQAPADIRGEDRKAGGGGQGRDQDIEGTAGEHDRDDEVCAAPGKVGEGDLEGAGQPAEGMRTEERESKDEEAPEGREATFAPAQMSDEKEDHQEDPYREVVEKMNAGMARIRKLIDLHDWFWIEKELILMKACLDDAKKIEEKQSNTGTSKIEIYHKATVSREAQAGAAAAAPERRDDGG